MSNIIAVMILIAIIGAAVAYLVRAKKKGSKCIGCPASANCGIKNLEHLRQSEHKCDCHEDK